MSIRRVPVDLGELEMALTDHDGAECFLDTESGEILRISTLMTHDEQAEIYDQIDEAPSERYVSIDPLPSSLEYGDMADFADSVADKSLARLLQVALNGKGAFRRFKDVLLDFPEERDRWFEFRDTRLHQRILEWLEENDLALPEAR